MRYWLIGLLTVIVAVGQMTLAPFLRIGGGTPDLIVAVTVSCGLLFGWRVGMGVGATAGLIVDLAFGRIIGLQTLAYGIVGWVCGLTEEKVFKDNWILPSLGGAVASILVQSLALGVMMLFGRMFDVWQEYRMVIFPTSLYNMILTTFVYTGLLRLHRYIRPDPRGTFALRRS